MKGSTDSIRKILIGKAAEEHLCAQYQELINKYQLHIDFRPFLEIVPISLASFRKYKALIDKQTAILFTSKISIQHFYELAEATNIYPPSDVNYFCVNQPLADYLQKYVRLKKRKLFVGGKNFADLIPILAKHKSKKFLLPSSEPSRKDIIKFFQKDDYNYEEIVIQQVVPCDLTDLDISTYELIVFFGILEVETFSNSFPDLGSSNVRIATFGEQTARAVKKQGWHPYVQAPRAESPSMQSALDQYFKQLSNTN